jgi:hypothetical protein
VQSGKQVGIHKTIIYGRGGVGKSSLAAAIQQLGVRVLFIDINDDSDFLDVDRIKPESWDEMRSVLHDSALCSQYGAIVVADLTKAEEFAAKWVIANVPHEKEGVAISSIESYGWGKGMTHTYEAFLQLLGDLDAQKRAGRHVICLAHDCTVSPENPEGENYSQFQPRLQSPSSGKNSIRHRVLEWCEHMLFVNFDVFVNKDGKGVGGGSRTIYPCMMPGYWAKSRELSAPIRYDKGSADLWKQLLKK